MKKKIHLKEQMLPVPQNSGFRMEGYWIWCGSVAKGEDQRYHMFASRWPKSQPMHPGWLLESEIVRAVSVSGRPEGPYQYEETVFPARGPQYWDGRMTHNPHIMKRGNQWILYYTGSTHPFADLTGEEHLQLEDPRVIVARANKRVGIAVAERIDGPWKRFDAPVLPVRPNSFDSLLTSNPAPCFAGGQADHNSPESEDNGGVLLMYKYRSYKEPPYTGLLHSAMKLSVAWADAAEGPYKRDAGAALFPENVELEDPFIWREDNGSESRYIMIAKDMHGNVCGEKYGGVYAYSKDGRIWELQYGELAYSRKVQWDNGKEELMGNMERPFILFEDKKATCIFFAVSNGTDSFRDATETWNMAIPLKSHIV